MSLQTRRALNQLLGDALCDQELRAALLNGHRADVITLLGLSEEEEDFVLSISAGTLQEFAQKLHYWLDDGRHEEQPLGTIRCGCSLRFSTGEGMTGGRHGDRSD